MAHKKNNNNKVLYWSYVFLSLAVILILSVFLGIDENKITHDPYTEPFCNCFGAQYNGAAANPDLNYYPYIYCYDKQKFRKAYEEGKFLPEWSGV